MANKGHMEYNYMQILSFDFYTRLGGTSTHGRLHEGI